MPFADKSEKATSAPVYPAGAGVPRAGRWAFATAPLIAVDMACAVAALLIAYSLRYSAPGLSAEAIRLNPTVQPYLPLIVFAPFVRAFANHSLGLYDVRFRADRPATVLLRVAKAICLGSVILMLVAFLYRGTFVQEGFAYSRYIFAMDALLNLFAVTGVHTLVGTVRDELRRRGVGTRRVAVQGGGAAATALRAELGRHPELGFVMAGGLSQAEEAALADLDELRALVNRHRLDEIIITEGYRLGSDMVNLVERCHKLGVIVKVVPDFRGVPLHGRAIEDLAGQPVIQVNEVAIEGFSRVLKRTEDVVLSLLGLLVTLPILLLTAVAIRLDSPGPVFFRQDRVGTHGRVFTLYKFRSMRRDAEGLRTRLEEANESDGVLFKMKTDPRVTRVGRVIRRLCIDELPQLFNILRGDMSLVGPRPLPVVDYERNGDWRHARLSVTPGLTGLWQVNRVRHTAEEMTRWDLYYVENWSLWLDIKILLKTCRVVVTGKGEW